MDVNSLARRRSLPKRALSLGAGALLACGVLAACSTTDDGGGDGEGGGSTLSQIEEEGTVTVGFANEQPYGFTDGGDLVGEAPAIHGEIFSRIGDVEVDGRQFDFGALIPALNAGEVDVVSAGMFITPERCQEAAFSNPEYVAKTALLVESGNPMNLSDYESVANSDARIAVMNGAVEVDQASAAGIPEGQTQIVADQQGGLDAVKSGRVDAFALTDISLNWLAKDDNAVEVTESFTPVVDGEEQLGVGAAVFRQDDNELREAFNEELEALLQEDGAWLELVEEYGFTEANKPEPDMTAEQFCEG
jgi:polar amino acid transport system substrate-binding protein